MLSLYIQVSEEENPAGHVMEGPSPSTVTDKMSGDVDPADHVPDSGPPPRITDQISTPQDEEYARQLQSELDAKSDIQDRGRPLHGDLQPSRTVSHVRSDWGIAHIQLLDLGLMSFISFSTPG